MAKGKRQSPGIGRTGIGGNSGFPDIADVRSALAIEMVFEEQFKSLREKHKRARKGMEAKGVRLDDLSFMKSVRDLTGTEVVDEFKRHWHLVGALFEEQTEQLDIFAPKPSAGPVRQAHFTMGLMAGLQGKELEIPPMVVGDDRNQMIAGYNEGRERRAAALPMVLAEAMENAEQGKTTDGTGKGAAAAAKVAEQAKEDFAKDQKEAGAEDPLVVNGERYATMRQANAARARLAKQEAEKPPAETNGRSAKFWDDYPEDNGTWTEEQKDAFCKWFDALPEGPEPIEIEHKGAAAEFLRLRDAGAPEVAPEEPAGFLSAETPVVGDDVQPPAPAAPVKRPVARPDFHDWPTDWTTWSGVQEMEFRRWVESLGPDVVPAITHEGAVGFFRAIREEQANRALAGADEDQDEWDAAAPKAEEPDLSEEAIAAKAKALQESGFVPPKNGRRKKA